MNDLLEPSEYKLSDLVGAHTIGVCQTRACVADSSLVFKANLPGYSNPACLVYQNPVGCCDISGAAQLWVNLPETLSLAHDLAITSIGSLKAPQSYTPQNSYLSAVGETHTLTSAVGLSPGSALLKAWNPLDSSIAPRTTLWDVSGYGKPWEFDTELGGHKLIVPASAGKFQDLSGLGRFSSFNTELGAAPHSIISSSGCVGYVDSTLRGIETPRVHVEVISSPFGGVRGLFSEFQMSPGKIICTQPGSASCLGISSSDRVISGVTSILTADGRLRGYLGSGETFSILGNQRTDLVGSMKLLEHDYGINQNSASAGIFPSDTQFLRSGLAPTETNSLSHGRSLLNLGGGDSPTAFIASRVGYDYSPYSTSLRTGAHSTPCWVMPVRVGGRVKICDRLYFGQRTSGGATVPEPAWKKFLAEVITPRFPAGLTVLRGEGQWRDTSGSIIEEPSFVLEVVYDDEDSDKERAIQEIRTEYMRRFSQESVMRLCSRVEVSF